jgi:hypothetical protein
MSLIPICNLASYSSWSLRKLKMMSDNPVNSPVIPRILEYTPSLTELHLQDPSRDVVRALIVDPLHPGRALLPQLELLCIAKVESEASFTDEDLVRTISSRAQDGEIVKSLKVLILARSNTKMTGWEADTCEVLRANGMKIREVTFRYCDSAHIF